MSSDHFEQTEQAKRVKPAGDIERDLGRVKVDFRGEMSDDIKQKVRSWGSAIEKGFESGLRIPVVVSVKEDAKGRDVVSVTLHDVYADDEEPIELSPDDPSAEVQRRCRNAFSKLASRHPKTQGAK